MPVIMLVLLHNASEVINMKCISYMIFQQYASPVLSTKKAFNICHTVFTHIPNTYTHTHMLHFHMVHTPMAETLRKCMLLGITP